MNKELIAGLARVTLEEATIDWYAQDKQWNVWYFGEDTKEYKDGKVAGTAGAWEAGVDGAKPGIIMKAKPAGVVTLPWADAMSRSPAPAAG